MERSKKRKLPPRTSLKLADPKNRTDLAARLQSRDGKRVITAGAMNAILDFNKGRN